MYHRIAFTKKTAISPYLTKRMGAGRTYQGKRNNNAEGTRQIGSVT